MSERERESEFIFMPRDQFPMDDSNNHYMKLISSSNNKTSRQRKDKTVAQASTVWHLRTLGEANKDETARREGDRIIRKEKKRERNEKEKGRIKRVRCGQEREMRGDREQRARVIGQRRAPLSSSAMRPPARRAGECSGRGDGTPRRGTDTAGRRTGNAARRETAFVYTSLRITRRALARSVTRARPRSMRESRGTRRA